MSPRIHRPAFDPADQPEGIHFDLVWFVLVITATLILLCMASPMIG
jgi:hypothetical protein